MARIVVCEDDPVILKPVQVALRAQMEAGYRRGATAYVTKPFRAAELRAVITWVLERNRPASGESQT